MSDLKKPSIWKRQIPLKTKLPLIRAAARAMGFTELTDVEDPIDSTKRSDIGALIDELIVEALSRAAQGSGDGYQLHHEPEPFFAAVRQSPNTAKGEKISKFEAIRNFLGLPNDGKNQIVLSEAALVDAALRSAKILQKGSGYNLEEMIREGIRKVAQDLITRASTIDNFSDSDDAKKALRTAPGRNWDHYEKVLNELRAELGTPAWRYNKPMITVSVLSRRAETNDVQIRRWIAQKGITDVFDPKSAEKN